MDYSLRLMKPEDAYTQDNQILHDSGCIGHLRVDMDTNGLGFFTSWDTHSPGLKKSSFAAELDGVIHALRFGKEQDGILKNRESLRKFVNTVPQSTITQDNTYFGLRVDTDDYAYMLRLNPRRGDYAAYIYAYDRQMLDTYLEARQEQTVEQENMITVLVVEPGKEPYMKKIAPGLKSLQKEVGGWIEAVYPSDDPIAVICNEEGLPLNRALRDDEGHVYDIVAGSFLVTGLTDDSFASLTENLMQKYSNQFRCPEAFLRLDGKLVVIPQKLSARKESIVEKLKTTHEKTSPKISAKLKAVER